jgi:hypothetical protein
LSLSSLNSSGAIEIETLANTALGIFYLTVDPVGGEIDEEGRNFCQQPFEFHAPPYPARRFPFHGKIVRYPAHTQLIGLYSPPR